MKHWALVLTFVSMPLAASAAGTAYKWVDAEGNVHYSQQPPPAGSEIKGTFAVPKSAPPPPPSASADQSPSDEAPKAKEGEQSAEKSDDVTGMTPEELQQRNCEKARKFLNSLTSSDRVAMPDESGKLVELDKSRRAEETQRGQEMVDKYCKPAGEE